MRAIRAVKIPLEPMPESSPRSLPDLAKALTTHKAFECFILSMILLAGVVVGLETSVSLMESHGGLLHLADQYILWIFVAEALLKILSHGNKPWHYFHSPWNVFDFTIVVVCFLPLGGAYVAVLRLARILRVLRLITVVPRLQVLVSGLLRGIPSMFYVTILLAILFYAYAVMGVFLFRGNDPGHFGNLGAALTTLFRVVTLEDWTDVMYTAFHGSHVYPAQGPSPVGTEPHAFGWLGIFYFVSFVICGSMVMINLFIGVVLTSLTEAQAEQLREKMHLDDAGSHLGEIDQSLEEIQNKLDELRASINRQARG